MYLARVEDDIVALMALSLREDGLFDAADYEVWQKHMTSQGLYDDHWLLAYEAHEQGWLASVGPDDYVAEDEFFSILKSKNVRFYGSELSSADNEFAYGDDFVEAEEIPTDEDDDDDG